MIKFKDEVFWDYFIHPETGMITDEHGNVKTQHLYDGYMWVFIHSNAMQVHCIQAHTAWGYTKGFDAHHRDGNKLNNDLYNLEYLPHEKHSSITHKGKIISEAERKHHSEVMKGHEPPNKGKKMSEEQKHKLSEIKKGKPSPFKGRHLSDEVKKKLSDAHKGKKYKPRKLHLMP